MKVGDLKPEHDLELFCARPAGCPGSRRFTRAEAIERFGADFPLEQIRARSRCGLCGHKGAATIVRYVGSTGMV